MSGPFDTESVLDVNIRTEFAKRSHHAKPLSSWRKLYLELLEELAPGSVVEFGCGLVEFLARLPETVRRVGLDGNPGYAAEYAAAGIEFQAFDFDTEKPPVALEGFEVAVCSDVFEHLLYPQRLLGTIARALASDGLLLSHVPNEFRLRNLLPIMRGRAESVVYHTDTDEWTNPHLRRFTDHGYRRFLGLEFEYNLPLNRLKAPRIERRLSRVGLPVPFCLQGGPTYASTNSRETRDRIEKVVGGLLPG